MDAWPELRTGACTATQWSTGCFGAGRDRSHNDCCRSRSKGRTDNRETKQSPVNRALALPWEARSWELTRATNRPGTAVAVLARGYPSSLHRNPCASPAVKRRAFELYFPPCWGMGGGRARLGTGFGEVVVCLTS